MCVAGLIAAIAVVGCGGGGSSTSNRNTEMAQSVGKPEGQLNLVAWAGYVADPWKSDFTKETGCQVNVKEAGTSDEMVQLMRTGQYDGVSASGNASERLVDAGDVSPVNVDLVPNYKTIFSDLKDQPYNTFDGTHYGIPHGRGANLLMWNTNDVSPGAEVLVDHPRSEAGGQVQGQDLGLRRSDLHRRRRRLPEGAPAEPGDRQPVRAQRHAVQRRGQSAQAAAAERRRVLVGRRQADPGVHQRRRPGRNHVAVPVLPAQGR